MDKSSNFAGTSLMGHNVESFRGVPFKNCDLRLDGKIFEHCTFQNCRLFYAGGEIPQFSNVSFDSCAWHFEEGAARTVLFIRMFSTAIGPDAGRAFLESLSLLSVPST
jgi:hypothetical protein